MQLSNIHIEIDATRTPNSKVIYMGISIWHGQVCVIDTAMTNSFRVMLGISRSGLYGLPLRENVKDWLVRANKECG